MARQPRQVTSDYDYTVEKVPVFTPEGENTGSFMTRRTDNGTILKVGVTKDYNVVNNAQVVDPVKDVLADLGLEATSEKYYVMNDGARFKARFEFKDEQIEIPQVGDVLGFRLDVDNSFNLMHRIRTIGGALRLACLNGMTTLDKEHGISAKHSNKFSIDSVIKAVRDSLTAFKALGDKNNIFTRMAGVNVSQEKGLNVLQNLTDKGTISEVRREGIARIWNNPSHEEDSERNLYNLLNATTQFATHEVAETHFEMSEKLTNNITKLFSKAVDNESSLNLLWKEPKKKEVVVTVTE